MGFCVFTAGQICYANNPFMRPHKAGGAFQLITFASSNEASVFWSATPSAAATYSGMAASVTSTATWRRLHLNLDQSLAMDTALNADKTGVSLL